MYDVMSWFNAKHMVCASCLSPQCDEPSGGLNCMPTHLTHLAFGIPAGFRAVRCAGEHHINHSRGCNHHAKLMQESEGTPCLTVDIVCECVKLSRGGCRPHTHTRPHTHMCTHTHTIIWLSMSPPLLLMLLITLHPSIAGLDYILWSCLMKHKWMRWSYNNMPLWLHLWRRILMVLWGEPLQLNGP